MREVLVNRFGGLSLPRKSVVRLTDRPDMTLDVYRGRKTTIQQRQLPLLNQWKEKRKCVTGPGIESGNLAFESDALPTALRGPASYMK